MGTKLAQPIGTTPDSTALMRRLEQTEEEVHLAPHRALGLKLAAKHLINVVVSLWASNLTLLAYHKETKQENAALHHMLAVLLARHGELRFSKEDMESVDLDRRIRGFCVPGSSDVVIRNSDEGLLTADAPRWLAEAVQGRPVPELTTKGVERLLPVFDITDLALRNPA